MVAWSEGMVARHGVAWGLRGVAWWCVCMCVAAVAWALLPVVPREECALCACGVALQRAPERVDERETAAWSRGGAWRYVV